MSFHGAADVGRFDLGASPEDAARGNREQTETEEEAVFGIADAIALDAKARPRFVVDWKSDVDPSPETVEHYRAQVRTYLDMTGANRGLMVIMTGGRMIEFRRPG